MAQFKLGAIVFKSKSEAKKACGRVLATSALGQNLESEAYLLIRALLDHHPSVRNKLDGGCVGIRVLEHHRSGVGKQRCFYIVRENGSLLDFAYTKCFMLANRLANKEAADACRRAVNEITTAYKHQRVGDGRVDTCDETGVELTWGDANVDHFGKWSFARIFDEWVELRGGLPKVIDRGSYQELSVEDARNFIAFHNARATLRLVHRVVN